ncbi:hypothetical protein [Brucella tritici]|uniref:hypothetical protein n=1 Tax=Brucella tritici TaxID=94626 RepID=UPI0020016004|nr:hypothetical protein [Brucella tritici]
MNNKIVDFTEALQKQRNETDNIASEVSKTLKSGGGGGTFDGMEARVSKLESLAEDTRGTLESIQRQLARMDERLQNMPTTEKVYTAIFTVYGLSFTVIAAAAGIFALMR